MGRYPRKARGARLKCVSCNAPVTVTVDDEYICVECGNTVLEPRLSAGDTVHSNAIDHRHDTPVADGSGSITISSNGSRVKQRDREAPAAESVHEDGLLPADSAHLPDISFVLPTKNEEEGIGACMDRALHAITELGMTAEIIVSDSSTDRTPMIAHDRGAIVVEPEAEGYGAAYKCGFEHARGEYIVMGDADTTYDFGELPSLIEPILAGEADMVMGSRLEGEIKPGAMPRLHQYVGNPLLTAFLNVFYDTGVSDAHSGFRVFTRETLERLEVSSDGMEFASEMVMDAGTKGLRIHEEPITYHERVGEPKLESFRDGWRHVKFMLTNCPTYLFSVPGVVIATLGIAIMALSFFNVQPGIITFGIHTMITGSLLLLVGYHITVLSLATTFAADPIRKPRDPLTRWAEVSFRLEHGATLGLIILSIGALYAAYLAVGWMTGTMSAGFVPEHLLAFTLVLLGLETVFYSFHLSALAD